MPVNVALPKRVATRRLNLGGISMPVNVALPERVAARRLNRTNATIHRLVSTIIPIHIDHRNQFHSPVRTQDIPPEMFSHDDAHVGF